MQDEAVMNVKVTVRKFRWRAGVPLWLRTTLRSCFLREVPEGDDFDHIELEVGTEAA